MLKQSSREERAAELRADKGALPFDDDDGHTVADMSVLDGSPSAPGAFPGSKRDVREELGDPDDRRALIFGATWAGLSIGLVYIIVFAAVIALMIWAWR